MWRIATYVFLGLTLLSPVALEITRSLVHRSRERRSGVGGTQDIAMWGTLVVLVWAVCAFVSVMMWRLGR